MAAEGSLASVAWPVHASSCQGTICCDFIFRFSSMHIFPQRLKLVKYLLPIPLLLQSVSSSTDCGQLGTGDQVSMH